MHPTDLRVDAVRQTYQLCGRYLLCRENVFDTVAHCNKFYEWLGHIDVTAHRATIVRVIAEKMTICFAGLYAESEFDAATIA